jgi:hypothetical protein
MRKKLFGKKNPMFKDGRTKRGASCIDCGKHLINWFTKRCNSCARKGKLNSQYKSGDTFCIDCGKKISRYSKRCKSCRGKTISGKGNPMFGVHRLGKNSPSYKNGKPKCKNCGKTIWYGSILCGECLGKSRRGNNSPLWKDKPKCIDCGKTFSRIKKGRLRCQKCRIKFYRGSIVFQFGKPAYHGKWTSYKNIKFRSTWEANFAKWCDGSGIKWQYEPKAFNLGESTYRPDFYLPAFDCWIEIKGYWRNDAKKKVKLFYKKYSMINLKIFDKQKLQMFGIINF